MVGRLQERDGRSPNGPRLDKPWTASDAARGREWRELVGELDFMRCSRTSRAVRGRVHPAPQDTLNRGDAGWLLRLSNGLPSLGRGGTKG
jgi:hypothetical protein